MKALLCVPPGVDLTEVGVPIAQNGEVSVRVRVAGICRTDLELTRGYMGFQGILGHEFVGEMASPHGDFSQKTRVVGEINAGCGQCDYCRRGLQRHCPNRSVLGILNRSGCMAEYLTLPPENLVAVPDDIPDEMAVFTEPLAAALEIFEQLHIPPFRRVCILGDGKLGILIAMTFAFQHSGETVLLGHHSRKLDTVKDLVGVQLEDSVPQTWNKQWDVVVEATGSSQGLKKAMSLVKPRGVIVLKSTMAHAEPLDLTPLVIDEIQVLGSRCGQFKPALEFMRKHPLPLERLVEAVYPLEQAPAAWEHAQRRGAKKVLLQIL